MFLTQTTWDALDHEPNDFGTTRCDGVIYAGYDRPWSGSIYFPILSGKLPPSASWALF